MVATGAGSAEIDERLVAVCVQLLERLDTLAREIAVALTEQLSQYSTLMSFDELTEAVRRNIEGIIESVRLSRTQSLTGPRATGRRRAEQGIPLDVVLAGYRLGVMHVWDGLVVACEESDRVHVDAQRPARATRALLAAASALWTEFDTHAHEVSSSYNEVAAERFRHDHRRRQSLLSMLFSGEPGPDRTLVAVAGLLGISPDGPFVVVMTDPSSPGSDNSEIARILLQENRIESVWKSGPHWDLSLATVDAPADVDRIAAQVVRFRLGRAGISRPFSGLGGISTAVSQARLARDAGSVGQRIVTRFNDAQVSALLLSSPDLAAGLVRHVFGPMQALSESDREMLVATLRAWFDNDGSIESTAGSLHCHPNTVRYRLNKLTSALGRDLKSPMDIVHLHLAAEAVRLRAPRA